MGLRRRGTMNVDIAIVPAPNPIAAFRNSSTGRYSLIAPPVRARDRPIARYQPSSSLRNAEALRRAAALLVQLLHGFGQGRHHLEQVAHQSVVGDLEDGRLGIRSEERRVGKEDR